MRQHTGQVSADGISALREFAEDSTVATLSARASARSSL